MGAHQESTLRTRTLWMLGACLGVVALTFGLASVAGAQDTSPLPVDGVAGRDVAASNNIQAEVRALESIGNTVWAGGLFLEVVDRSAGTRIDHPYLAAFDANTGEFLPFLLTTPNGPVYDIRDLGDGRMLIAGEFTAVNSVPSTAGLAIIDTTTGKVDRTFQASISGGNGDPAVLSVDIDSGWIYAVGSFTRIRGGSDASFTNVGGAARLSLTTGAVDPSWTPQLEGGGGWGVAVAAGQRVHIGGYFTSANGTDGTEALATFDTVSGALVPGWNHGIPWSLRLNWNSIGGAVNDLDVAGDLLYVAGAKHSYAVMQSGTGEVVRLGPTTNDAQTVEIQNGLVYIGCHCSGSLEWTQVVDAATGVELSDNVAEHLRGAAGTWATTVDANGCVWHGGNFSSEVVDGVRTAVYGMARTCDIDPPGGTGQQLPDTSEPDPGVPGAPTVTAQQGSTVTISWPGAPTTQDLRYQVLRNGVPVGVAGTNSFIDYFVPAGTHDWQVQAIAFDGDAGLVSPRSNAITLASAQNVAPAGSAYGLGGAALPAAIDGSEAANGSERFVEIDLGRQVQVDRLEIVGTSLSRARVILATDPIQSEVFVEAQDEQHRTIPMDAAPELSTTIPVASTIRYVRVQRSGNGTVRIAEIRVLATPDYTAAPDRAVDTTPPTPPVWASKSGFATAGSFYRWGGAADDVAVAYYELYRGNELLARRPSAFDVGLDGDLPSAATGIVAFDADGNASANLPLGPPPAPTCAAELDGESIKLSIDGVETDADVIVFRSRNGGSFFWAGRLSGDGSIEWNNTNVNVGSTYAYEVLARSASGDSDRAPCGDPVEIVPVGGFALAPTACSAVVVDGAVEVSWTLDVADASEAAIIFRSRDGGPFYWAGRVSSDTTSFTNTSVVVGSAYAYRVVTQNGLGNSDPTPCGDPVALDTASLDGPAECLIDAATMTISFSEVPDAEFAIVQRSREGGAFGWTARLNAPVSEWTDTRTISGVSYQYRVIARDGAIAAEPVLCGDPVVAP